MKASAKTLVFETAYFVVLDRFLIAFITPKYHLICYLICCLVVLLGVSLPQPPPGEGEGGGGGGIPGARTPAGDLNEAGAGPGEGWPRRALAVWCGWAVRVCLGLLLSVVLGTSNARTLILLIWRCLP